MSDRKRKRLTFACNACRARKVKCDDRHPKCSNCSKGGIECITTDPRQPGTTVARKEAQLAPDWPSESASSPSASIARIENPPTSSTSTQHPAARPWENLVNSSETREDVGSRARLFTPTSAPDASLPLLPRFISGNGLQVLTQWLELAFARIGVPRGFSGLYSNQHVASVGLDTSSSQYPPLHESDVQSCARTYSASMNSVFPLFSTSVIGEMLEEYAMQSSRDGHQLPSSRTAIATLIISIAEPSDVGYGTHGNLEHVYAAYNLLGAILAEGSLRSTQALFLLALLFRAYNELILAWHLITMATSLAQSLGMHRTINPQRHAILDETLAEEHATNWWAIYCLEKTLSLELERASSIRETECNQAMPKVNGPDSHFQAIIGLAKIQGQINERCMRARSSEDGAKHYADIVCEKIVNTGELDQMLLSWAETLPHDIRPSNHMYCDSALLPCASFLAIQYHQTLVLLYRNAMLVNAQSVGREIDMFCSDKPYVRRLKSGPAICVNAARSIVAVLEHAHSQQQSFVLQTINAPLIATYALAVHSLKHPASGPAKADVELQARAIFFVQKQQSTMNRDASETREILDALQIKVAAVVTDAQRFSTPQAFISPKPGPSHTAITPSHDVYDDPLASVPSVTWTSGSEVMQYAPAALMTGSIPEAATTHMYSAWTDMYNQDNTLSGDGLDFNDVDWDALVTAFDLPS